MPRGQTSAQWPQPVHFSESTSGRKSLTTMASAGHSRWHFMQPMQPALHIFVTDAPLSRLRQAGWMRRLSGIRLMMLLGQASTQAPQPTHLLRFTRATPLAKCIASKLQTLTQLPMPMQAKVQSLLLLPPKSIAARQSRGPE